MQDIKRFINEQLLVVLLTSSQDSQKASGNTRTNLPGFRPGPKVF